MPQMSLSVLGGVLFDAFIEGIEPQISIIGGIVGMIIYKILAIILIKLNKYAKRIKAWNKK